MEDKFLKYTRLSIIIFLLFLAVPIVVTVVLGLFYGFGKLIASRPADAAVEIFVLSLPGLVFATVYTIFFRRTKFHPSKIVKAISYFLFVVGIGFALYFLVNDLLYYFKVNRKTITSYLSYNVLYLFINIVALFFIAVIQAFSQPKEKDWMQKASEREI
jgi:hypothetical protein